MIVHLDFILRFWITFLFSSYNNLRWTHADKAVKRYVLYPDHLENLSYIFKGIWSTLKLCRYWICEAIPTYPFDFQLSVCPPAVATSSAIRFTINSSFYSKVLNLRFVAFQYFVNSEIEDTQSSGLTTNPKYIIRCSLEINIHKIFPSKMVIW